MDILQSLILAILDKRSPDLCTLHAAVGDYLMEYRPRYVMTIDNLLALKLAEVTTKIFGLPAYIVLPGETLYLSRKEAQEAYRWRLESILTRKCNECHGNGSVSGELGKTFLEVMQDISRHVLRKPRKCTRCNGSGRLPYPFL